MPAFPRLRRKRGEPRLDPVRWRRPGRGTLIRLIAVAVLLTAGVAAAWWPPACVSPSASGAASRSSGVGAGPLDRASSSRPPGSPARAGPGAPVAASAGERPAPNAGDDGSADPPVAGGLGGSPAGSADGIRRAVPPDRVGVPVRLVEPAGLALVRPGDLVDLLRVDEAGHGVTTVATAAPVLAVTGADDPTAGGLLLALRADEAQRAVAAHGPGFAIVLRGGRSSARAP